MFCDIVIVFPPSPSILGEENVPFTSSKLIPSNNSLCLLFRLSYVHQSFEYKYQHRNRNKCRQYMYPLNYEYLF